MLKRILSILLSLILLTACALAEEAPAAAVVGETVTIPDVIEELPAFVTPDKALEQLIPMLAQHLSAQDYTLDVLTSDGQQTVHVGSADGKTVQLEISGDGMEPVAILLDGATISSPSTGESYTYSEALNLLFGLAGESIAEQGLSLDGMFNEQDLDFLETIADLVYYELLNAGALPVVKYAGGDTYFTVSITPDLLHTAGVRLMEKLLDYQAEIDSLLTRTEPLLRALAPSMYRTYDSETQMYVERETYTCAELQTLFKQWMTRQWLQEWNIFEGMHLDVSGFIGDDGWHVDAAFFVPGDEGSIWFELDGDESGRFDGMLEYFEEGYSRASEQYEMQAWRFNIDGAVMNSGLTLRVRPETPSAEFTGLRIDFAVDSSGLVFDAVTDLLDFRMEAADQLLDLSMVMEEYLLDVHLSWFGGIPCGSAVYQNGWDGVYLKLNEAK